MNKHLFEKQQAKNNGEIITMQILEDRSIILNRPNEESMILFTPGKKVNIEGIMSLSLEEAIIVDSLMDDVVQFQAQNTELFN